MDIIKVKSKDGIQDLQAVRGSEDKPASPHYPYIACKFGKELDLSWRSLYQEFTHEDYSHLPYD